MSTFTVPQLITSCIVEILASHKPGKHHAMSASPPLRISTCHEEPWSSSSHSVCNLEILDSRGLNGAFHAVLEPGNTPDAVETWHMLVCRLRKGYIGVEMRKWPRNGGSGSMQSWCRCISCTSCCCKCIPHSVFDPSLQMGFTCHTRPPWHTGCNNMSSIRTTRNSCRGRSREC